MYHIIKENLKPLKKCSKSHDLAGNPANRDKGEYSEWILMSSLWNLSDKELVSAEDVAVEMEKIRIDLILSDLYDQGMIEMHFEEKTGEASYSITEKGLKYLDDKVDGIL